MRLEIINGMQILIIAFLSYIITIPFAGWFEALVAKKVGDDVPEQAGFLTLNPLEHFNVFGFAAVLWGIFFAHALPFQLIPGWGRYIPLVPDNIRGQYYKLRIFIEYIGRSFAHLFLLIAAVTTMMLVCGAAHVRGLTPMLLASSTSSFKEVIVSLLYFICQQNLVLFVIHFILGIFKYLIYFHMSKLREVSVMTMIFGFILLMIGLSIFGPLLEIFAANIIEGIRLILLRVIK
ncbi:MAG: hypothetical protein Q8Q60_00600 [Candidatus Chromulinivorax sp.]|nr:hypothetical protein [Candidatus Chromulinivorax sp.]